MFEKFACTRSHISNAWIPVIWLLFVSVDEIEYESLWLSALLVSSILSTRANGRRTCIYSAGGTVAANCLVISNMKFHTNVISNHQLDMTKIASDSEICLDIHFERNATSYGSPLWLRLSRSSSSNSSPCHSNRFDPSSYIIIIVHLAFSMFFFQCRIKYLLFTSCHFSL